MNSSDKISLRKHIRQQRRTLSRAQQTRAAQQVGGRILRTHWWRAATRIAFYWPADGELSLLPLLRETLRRGKKCYLPVVEGKALIFREFRPGKPLNRNRYGIPEPLNSASLGAHELDVIFLPLVAFDERCNRLGMGAGFYDRTLAHSAKQKPLRIGIAHELQKVESLPIDPWDVPLHAVITDRRRYLPQ